MLDRGREASWHQPQRLRAGGHRPPGEARESLAAREQTLALTPEEQLAFWKALAEPPKLTEAQRRLGSIMRGEE